MIGQYDARAWEESEVSSTKNPKSFFLAGNEKEWNGMECNPSPIFINI